MGMDKAVAAKQVDALERMIDQRRSWMNGDPAHDQMMKAEVATLRFAIAAIQCMPADPSDYVTIKLQEGASAYVTKSPDGTYNVGIHRGKML